MSDLWEKQSLAEHRDRLVRARQAEAERSREFREQQRSNAKTQAAAIAQEGNLDAIRLLHDLEPEKRHWDLTALIEEERIKLETLTGRVAVETREQIRLISAELIRELVLRREDLLHVEMEAEWKRRQTLLERKFDLLSEREKASQLQDQSRLDHAQGIERSEVDHMHAKDFKTHETDETIRLSRATQYLTPEEVAEVAARLDQQASKTNPSLDED